MELIIHPKTANQPIPLHHIATGLWIRNATINVIYDQIRSTNDYYADIGLWMCVQLKLIFLIIIHCHKFIVSKFSCE